MPRTTKTQKTTSQPSFQVLTQELDAVVLQLDDPALDIDAAVAAYERGLALIKQLETALTATEHRIDVMRAEFDQRAGESA